MTHVTWLMWHDSLTCVTWLMWHDSCNMTHSCVWPDPSMCATWFIHLRDMTRSCVWRGSFICVSSYIQTCPFVLKRKGASHSSSYRALHIYRLAPSYSSYICTLHMKTLHIYEDWVFIYMKSLHIYEEYEGASLYTWRDTYEWASLHLCMSLYIWREPFLFKGASLYIWRVRGMCVTWLIHVCDMTHGTWLVDARDMTHVACLIYVCDSFICVW